MAVACGVMVSASVLGLVGCGGAAAGGAKSMDSAAPPGDAPVSVDSALGDLDRGEWRITELFGPPPGVREAVKTAPEAPPAASASPTVTSDAGRPTEMSGGEPKQADACTIACTALQSMDRAARHICEMSGPDEPRCESARERVKNANDRVAAHCTCGI